MIFVMRYLDRLVIFLFILVIILVLLDIICVATYTCFRWLDRRMDA
jgi:hypothetical protein